jgi:hypothetical protein
VRGVKGGASPSGGPSDRSTKPLSHSAKDLNESDEADDESSAFRDNAGNADANRIKTDNGRTSYTDPVSPPTPAQHGLHRSRKACIDDEVRRKWRTLGRSPHKEAGAPRTSDQHPSRMASYADGERCSSSGRRDESPFPPDSRQLHLECPRLSLASASLSRPLSTCCARLPTPASPAGHGLTHEGWSTP